MKIHNVTQKSEEWLELRKGKITGSTLKDVLDKKRGKQEWSFNPDKPKTTIYSLLAHYLAEPDEDGLESNMERGNRLEREAILNFANLTGVDYKEVGFITRDDDERIAISPDGLSEDQTRAPEVKCLSAANHLEMYKTRDATAYLLQVVQLFIAIDSLNLVDLLFYDPRFKNNDIKLFSIQYTREELSGLIESVRAAENQVLEYITQQIKQLS